MKIGVLAQLTNTQTNTIRFYEREALLPDAERSDSNYRIYGDEHVERLSFIRHCRSLDMTLNEIRLLLHFKDAPREKCDEVNQLLDEHIGQVAHRIRDLRKLEKQLTALRHQCQAGRQAVDCGILLKLTDTACGMTHGRNKPPDPASKSFNARSHQSIKRPGKHESQ